MRIQQRGFTLIELVLSLVIISLLIAWGIPGYRNLKLRQDLTGYANEIVYSFTLARAEAIRRGTTINVVKTGAQWHDGWRVINPADNTVLAQQDPFSGGFQLAMTTGVDADMAFNNLGGLINQPVAFLLTHSDLTKSRRIQVNAAGSTRAVDL